MLPPDRNVVSLLIMAWRDCDLLGVSSAPDVNSRGFETLGDNKNSACMLCNMEKTCIRVCLQTHMHKHTRSTQGVKTR